MGGFGTDLVGGEFVPVGARAGLLVVHGMAEHRGRYAESVRRFNEQGIACFTFDLRGHGESPGNRADIPSFQTYVDDLIAVRHHIREAHPTLPLFIWAHSLGSIVAIRSVEQDAGGLRGVITSGCPIDAFPKLPSPVRGTVVALFTPFRSMLVNPGLPSKDLSHSKSVQAQYEQDPLVPDKVTVRLLIELESACRAALADAGTITVPWLALHGEADNIAPPSGSKKLVDALGSTDKTLKLFAGMRHEVHNEIEPAASEFHGLVIHWIGQRAAV
jgi:alpha-beta hydrolase superfamily lysophospholipase